MGKVMVTGALGNVGGYVAKYLIESGQERETLLTRY